MNTLPRPASRRHAARLSSRPGSRPTRSRRRGRFGAGLIAPAPAAVAAEGTDPATWPAWTDADCREPNGPAGGDDLGRADPCDADEDQGEPIDLAEPFAAPEPDAEPATLTLPEWIEVQATRYQALATHAGEMIGTTLRDLAAMVRLVGTQDPETAAARLAALDASRLAARWSDACN